jgi:plastocyanin
VTLLKRGLFPLFVLLGASVSVLPTVAGGSEPPPSISAVNGATHYWSPATATVGENGVVTLSNPTNVPHGVEWVSGPATPSCSSGVPVGKSAAASGTKWSGTCTFATPGVYTFYCTVHGSEMTGTVSVSADGMTTTSMTMGSTETSTGSTTVSTPSSSSPGQTQPPNQTSSGPGAPAIAGAPSSLLLGSAASALKLAAAQHGHSVHGSIELSNAAAGGRLEVQLLAARASLASTAQRSRVRVGRFVHSPLHAGTVSFIVTLNAAAVHALHVHGRIALSVRIVLTPAHGSAVAITRSVVVRG